MTKTTPSHSWLTTTIGFVGREHDAMRLVVKGLLTKQVAGELGTSQITVKIQRGQVLRKMATANVANLVRMAKKLAAFADNR